MSKMDNPFEAWRKYFNHSKYKLEKEVPMSHQTTYTVFQTGKASQRTIEKLINYWRIELWQIHFGPPGYRESEKSYDCVADNHTPQYGEKQNDPDFFYVPRFEDPVAAGLPILNEDLVSSLLPFRRDFLKRLIPGYDSENRAVCAHVARGWIGESMIPLLHPGGLMLIDRNPSEVEMVCNFVSSGVDGQAPRLRDRSTYLICPDGKTGLTAKHAQLEGKKLLCWPQNPSPDNEAFTVVIRKGKQLKDFIRGRVVWEGHELP